MTPSSQLPANANASRRAFIGHEGSAPRARGKMNYDGYFSGFRGFAGGVSFDVLLLSRIVRRSPRLFVRCPRSPLPPTPPRARWRNGKAMREPRELEVEMEQP